MSQTRSQQQVLDEELLPLRAKLLEIAAALDRIDRSEGPPADAEIMGTLRGAIETLLRSEANRAEQIQLQFSLPYTDEWRTKLQL